MADLTTLQDIVFNIDKYRHEMLICYNNFKYTLDKLEKFDLEKYPELKENMSDLLKYCNRVKYLAYDPYEYGVEQTPIEYVLDWDCSDYIDRNTNKEQV